MQDILKDVFIVLNFSGMLAIGTWGIVVWARAKRDSQPGRRAIARFVRQLSGWGLPNATSADPDTVIELLLNWRRGQAKFALAVAIASFAASATAVPVLYVFRYEVLSSNAAYYGSYSLTFGLCYVFIMFIIGLGYEDGATQPETHPLPRYARIVLPSLVAGVALLYLAILALFGLGMLTPETPGFLDQHVSPRDSWLLGVLPVLALVGVALYECFVVRKLARTTPSLSHDPEVDRLLGNRLRAVHVYNLTTGFSFVFLFGLVQESSLIPVQFDTILYWVVTWLPLACVLAAMIVTLGGLMELDDQAQQHAVPFDVTG